MPKPEKVQAVDEIRESFRGAGAVLVTEYRGLKVKDLQDLRRRLAGAGASYKVLKNTLVRLAVRDLEVEELDALLEGPTALAFCTDPVAPAKVLSEFARANPSLVVKGGVLSGRVLDAGRARALADLDSREVLLARIAGTVQSPMAQALGVMQALLRNTASLVAAYRDQRSEGEPDSAPTPSIPEPSPEPAADAGPTAEES